MNVKFFHHYFFISLNKKIIFQLVTIFFATISTLSVLYVFQFSVYADRKITYEISTTGKKNINSKGSEARILEIKIDNSDLDLATLQNADSANSRYDENVLVLYNGKIEFSCNSDSNVQIQFLKHPWSGLVTIAHNNGQTKNVDLYSNEDGIYKFKNIFNPNILIQEYFSNPLSFSQWIQLIGIFISAYFIIFLCNLQCVRFYRLLLQCRLKLFDIILFMTSFFILCLSNLYITIHFLGRYLTVGILFLLLFIVFRNLKNMTISKPEFSYLLIAISIGTIMMLLLPPGHVLDENAHFIKSYEMSYLGKDSHTTQRKNFEEQGNVYIYLPKSIMQLFSDYSNTSTSCKYDLLRYFKDYNSRLNSEDLSSELQWFGNTANLSKLPYIPSSIICALLRIFNAPVIFIFTCMRFINLMISVIIGYYSIKILPKFKYILFIVLLFPITIQQSFGINQDWLTNAIFFLEIALILREIYNEKNQIDLRNIFMILFLSILLAYCKVGYFPCMFLVFLIPSNKFKKRSHELLIKMMLILPICFLSGFQYINALGTTNSDGPLPYYNITFVLNHPIKTLHIYANTLMRDGSYHFLNGLYNGFGWYSKYTNNLISAIICILYGYMIGASIDSQQKIKLIHRLVYFIVFLIISLFIYTSLFLGWTPNNSDTVQGLQPRYFIPALFFLYACIPNSYFSIKVKNTLYTYSLILTVILMIGVFTITDGYYF